MQCSAVASEPIHNYLSEAFTPSQSTEPKLFTITEPPGWLTNMMNVLHHPTILDGGAWRD
jgi:hypothetical protein